MATIDAQPPDGRPSGPARPEWERARATQRIRPSRLWYWIPGLVLVASVVWFAVGLTLLLGSTNHQIEELQRVPLPGQGQVTLTEPGKYVLYYEGPGADSEETIPAFSVSIEGQTKARFGDYSSGLTYDVEGRSGRAVKTFEIDEPGTFLVRTESEVEGTQASLAIGPSIAGGVLPGIVAPLVVFLAGAAVAAVIAIARNRARSQLTAPGATGHGAALAAGPDGWFADPSTRHELRYWDGHQWTDHVSDRGSQAIDPLPHPPGGPRAPNIA
jgi:hypothetical protein